MLIKKKTTNILEYKVGNNVKIPCPKCEDIKKLLLLVCAFRICTGAGWIHSTQIARSPVKFWLFGHFSQFWLGYTMVSYQKIYLEAFMNQYIWPKNNSVKLYLILGWAELHLNFSHIPKDGSDIHRFPNRKYDICEYHSYP